ncbi:MAG: MFS transporter [Xanthobacteraceae bacterium]|nr:MAG: MFS transporter [Xanthobacteraceae bacterium]
MPTTVSASSAAPPPSGWRTPAVVIACGCVIGLLAFGPRSTVGFFVQPMTTEFPWGRDVFAFAFAIQNLLWGIGQPVAGAIADRYGTARVLVTGVLFYAAGLMLMEVSSTPLMLMLSIGLTIGIGLSACSFNLVVTGFGKLIPEHMRSMAAGAATAAGSFGQFLYAPLGVALIDGVGWKSTLTVFAALTLIALPMTLAMRTPPAMATAGLDGAGRDLPAQSFRAAMAEAFSHRSYVLLVLGFFTCGFQLAFVTAHLPSYLIDRGLPAEVGGWVIAVIGLFNIAGALGVGWLANRYPSRYILALIYFTRAVSIALFISMPISVGSALAYGVVTGLTWLSTVPPTSGLVALMFGTRWLSTLFGIAFFSHQVGGFLGVWLGGIFFARTGSYDTVWWLSVLFGVLSALINLPIIEKPVARQAAATA